MYQDTISDCMVLEESIEDIQEENIQLSKALVLVQREISTHHRKQRPICEIIKELSEFINENPVPVTCSQLLQSPSSLVGKTISHKFELEGTCDERWYSGVIVNYNPATKMHEIEKKNTVFLTLPLTL